LSYSRKQADSSLKMTFFQLTYSPDVSEQMHVLNQLSNIFQNLELAYCLRKHSTRLVLLLYIS